MAETEPEKVGQRIRRLRLQRGLSQRELAEPGISYAYLSRIEAGQRSPSLRALRILARKLAVSAEYLETGAKVPKAAERELRLSDAELELRMGGDLDRAAEVFRAELDGPGTERDSVFEARAHAGLGLIASQLGKTRDATQHLREAVDSGYFPPEVRPDLYRALGHAYIDVAASHQAIELFEGCLRRVRDRASDDVGLTIKFAVYAASAYSTIGDAASVRRVLTEATELAENAAVASPARISVFWALARAAWSEAESDAALGYIHRAIGLLESTEDTYNLALAHLLAAQMLGLEGRGEEADLHLSRAEPLLALRGDTADLGLLRTEQAKRAAARGDGKTAVALATEAMRLVRDHAAYLGPAQHALGIARAAAGDEKRAENAYRAALKTLEQRSQWREASVVARELARLVREQGRDEEAFELLDKATTWSIYSTRGHQFTGQI
jgi:transcriptional regulator with XRE-family HTH domain